MTLHITNAYHATSGGISTFYHALLAYANAKRRPMRLIVPAAQSFVERIGDYGIIYHVQADESPIADKRYRVLWPWGATGRSMRQIIRAEQPELIEISDKYTLPMLAGLLRKNWISGVDHRPALVATSHERMDDTTKAYFGSPRLWSALSQVYLKHCYFPMFDAHIANSAYTAQELIPASQGHRLHREIRILPMGVDTESLNPIARTPESHAALARRASVPSEAILLLYVGRLATEKNLPMLVEMIASLPSNYYLILAGAGALEPWLRTHNNRIRLIGHVQREAIPGLYAGADAFVHANPNEPFGIAPLEAMAAGLPLVVPNAGGVLSYANTNNAWLAEPTPEAFVNTCEELFDNREEREARARRARETALEHDWSKIAGRYFAAYDEWIAAKDKWK